LFKRFVFIKIKVNSIIRNRITKRIFEKQRAAKNPTKKKGSNSYNGKEKQNPTYDRNE
jgi:hypothetical protein